MLTIESRYSGNYEIIGENRIMLCRVGTLETAVLVRSYLSGEDMTEDDKQTARAAIRTHDEDMQALHEAHERKRQKRLEREAARKRAKAEAAVANAE